jgi:hypothetical protein
MKRKAEPDEPDEPDQRSVRCWDNLIEGAVLPLLHNEAERLWQHSGGSCQHAQSFWVGETEPRCYLELLARQVLEFHREDLEKEAEKETAHGDNRKTVLGAEIWVQKRTQDGEQGLGLHFDKDEQALQVHAYLHTLVDIHYNSKYIQAYLTPSILKCLLKPSILLHVEVRCMVASCSGHGDLSHHGRGTFAGAVYSQ